MFDVSRSFCYRRWFPRVPPLQVLLIPRLVSAGLLPTVSSIRISEYFSLGFPNPVPPFSVSACPFTTVFGSRASLHYRVWFPQFPLLPFFVSVRPPPPFVVAVDLSTTVFAFLESLNYSFGFPQFPPQRFLVSAGVYTAVVGFHRYVYSRYQLSEVPPTTVVAARKSIQYRSWCPQIPLLPFLGSRKSCFYLFVFRRSLYYRYWFPRSILLPFWCPAVSSTAVLGSCRCLFRRFFASTDCCTTFFRFPHVRLPPCLVSAQMCM